MGKLLVGIIAGSALGFVDGVTAWLTPAVRPFIVGILIGSTVKGLIAGIVCGLIARRVKSVLVGLAAGAVLGLIFAYLVAAMPSETGDHHYLQVMLPGFIVGAITGVLTQRRKIPNAPCASPNPSSADNPRLGMDRSSYGRSAFATAPSPASTAAIRVPTAPSQPE